MIQLENTKGRPLAAFLIAALLFAPPPASADFAAPFRVSAAGEGGVHPQLAMEADGDALFVWGEFGGSIKARRRSAAGALGPIQTVAGPDVAFLPVPDMALDADGDALIVWEREEDDNGVVEARFRSAGGGWGRSSSSAAWGTPSRAIPKSPSLPMDTH